MSKTTTMYREIPLNQLMVSAQNVHVMNAAKKADSGLIASIRSKGLLQNIVVIANKTKFEVVAGGRRYAALKHLAKNKEIEADKIVGCELRSADENLIDGKYSQGSHAPCG